MNKETTNDSLNKDNNKEKEIDLREVFSGINNNFSKLFRWIKRSIIDFLLLINKYYKLILVISIIGGIIGSLYSFSGRPFYQSTMVIKSKDAYLDEEILGKILTELSSMCGVQDSMELSRILNITPHEATQIKSFELAKNEDPRNLALVYRKYYNFLSKIEDKQERDDLFEVLAATEYTNDIYTIKARAFDPTILPKLNQPLVEWLKQNTYFTKRKDMNIDILKQYKQKIIDELIQIDTLRQKLVYVLERENEYQKGSNNVVLSEQAKINPLPVYEKYLSMNKAALDIDATIMEQENRIEVLSGFVKLSYDMRVSALLGAIYGLFIGFFIGIAIAFSLALKKYLDNFIATNQSI